MELEDLKKNYELVAKKYKLPNFERMNEEFEIERIAIESDCILRAVRKVMMDKIVGWLRFFEMIMNPANAPRIYHSYLKNMTPEEKNLIDKLYNSFGKLNIAALLLEVDYSEKSEADLIKHVFDTNQEIKPMLRKIIANMRDPQENNFKKEKSYFG